MQTVKVKAVWYAPTQCWLLYHPVLLFARPSHKPHDGARALLRDLLERGFLL